MDHNYFKDKLSAYHDGALEAQERELIRRHLSDCEECRALLKEIERLDNAIEKHSGLSGDNYFEGLAQMIESKIATPVEKVVDVRSFRWKPVIWKISAAAASVLLVGTIGYYQWFQDDELKDRVMETAPSIGIEEQVKIDSAGGYAGGEKSAAKSAADDLDGDVALNEEIVTKSKKEAGAREDKRKNLKRQMIAADTEVRDEPPAPAAESPKEITNQPSGKTQEGQSSADESRYRTEGLSKITTEEEIAVDEIAEAVQLNIEDLRVQNTLLQSQLPSEGDVNQTLGRLKDSKPSIQSYAKLNAEAKVPDSLYQQLAVNWYQIGQVTKDSLEKDQAIQYLNWYKSNFPKDSVMTNQYLKEITPEK